MAFSPQFLDELRTRTSLAEVVGKRVKLIKKGSEFLGLCPFHNEKTPSFTLNEEKGFYHCFGCQSHGSAIDFIMETEGLGFRETVERLAASAGMQIADETPEQRERERKKQKTLHVLLRFPKNNNSSVVYAFFENIKQNVFVAALSDKKAQCKRECCCAYLHKSTVRTCKRG